jgi:hypothetical protein
MLKTVIIKEKSSLDILSSSLIRMLRYGKIITSLYADLKTAKISYFLQTVKIKNLSFQIPGIICPSEK